MEIPALSVSRPSLEDVYLELVGASSLEDETGARGTPSVAAGGPS